MGVGVSKMDEAFVKVEELTNKVLKEHQKIAIASVFDKKDVVVVMPTGYGKSLIYQSLPIVHKALGRSPPSATVLVISPLVALMKTQVKMLKGIGISASFIGEEHNADRVISSDVSVVYSSPEAIMMSGKWRQMLTTKPWQERLITVAIDEAHCICEWYAHVHVLIVDITLYRGTEFRKDYGYLGDLRSLVPVGIPFIALTATATPSTEKYIIAKLHMIDPVVIRSLPNRTNVSYCCLKVQCQPAVLNWLIDELRSKGARCERCIIYCRSVRMVSALYKHFHQELGPSAYWPLSADQASQIPENRLFGMYHRCSTESIKEVILNSLMSENGKCRVVFATVALGLGLDCRDIRLVVHVGSPRSFNGVVLPGKWQSRSGWETISCHSTLPWN